jgi:hypothetical protein
MAKKAKKQAAKKAGKKSVKKVGKKASKKAVSAKKPGARKKVGKKAGASKAALAPRPIKTGRGPGPAEVASGVVEMVRAGAPEKEIWARWFSPKLVSIEGSMGQAWHGRAAVRAKADWWYGTHEVHSLEAEGPYVGATGFGVKYTIDAEERATGKRWKGEELAFYTVRNGKVVQEEFMGKPM